MPFLVHADVELSDFDLRVGFALGSVVGLSEGLSVGLCVGLGPSPLGLSASGLLVPGVFFPKSPM